MIEGPLSCMGLQSKIQDAINRATPTFASATISQRGLSYFVDPSTTGLARFLQKSGYPFALFTPQMTATLSASVPQGATQALIEGARLVDWLLPGVTVAFELLEDVVVADVDIVNETQVLVTLESELSSSHLAGSAFTIVGFPIIAPAGAAEGDGAIGAPSVSVTSPFILVPGDTLRIDGAFYTIGQATKTGTTATGFEYDIKTNDLDGFPALTGATDILVEATAAYQSEILTVPHNDVRSLMSGPVAVDWVSTPMVADYFPTPDSTCYIEEFDAANRAITTPREIKQNDTLLRFPISRDQMLFWRVADGSVNWNGTFFELRAWDRGRAHIYTPGRPPLDAAPPISVAKTVPGFAPYLVLLLNRIVAGSVEVTNTATDEVIPESGYTVDETAGTISFDAAYANQPVVISYRPRMEWQLQAQADEDDIEICVKIDNEDLLVFNLGAAGTLNALTIPVNDLDEINLIHLTARRADDSPGPFIVQLGDWTPRGSITAAIRYTLILGAKVDYDWASSALLFKPIWPGIELLRARLDGDSLLARYLDNGRMLL